MNNETIIKLPKQVEEITSQLESKTNLNNDKTTVSSNTFGEGRNAVVDSAIAGEGENVRPHILSDYLPAMSKYKDRDSVARYTSNRSTNPTLKIIDGSGITYTLNTVTLPIGVDLSNVKKGMFIDTLHNIGYVSLIEKVEGNVITVKDGWYQYSENGTSTPSTPANNFGVVINQVTKIWGHNSNIWLMKEHETKKGVCGEYGIWNYNDNDNSNKDIGGLDVVNFVNQAWFGFRARARGILGKLKYGFLVGKNVEIGFGMEATTTTDKLIESTIYKTGTSERDAEQSYDVLVNGEQNKLKLPTRTYTNGQTSGSRSAKIIMLNKTIDEYFTLVSPVDKVGEQLTVINKGSDGQKLNIENNANFITGTKTLTMITMNPNSSAIFVSDGTNWVSVIGSYVSDGYLPNTGGNVNGNVSISGTTNSNGTITSSGNISAVGENSMIKTAQSVWNKGHYQMGGYHEWYDSTGKKRCKSGTPLNDLDGTIIGTQS